MKNVFSAFVICLLLIPTTTCADQYHYLGDDGNVYTEKGEIENTFQYKNISTDELIAEIKKVSNENHSGIQFFVLTPRRDDQGNQGAKQVYMLVFGKKNQLFKYTIRRVILTNTKAINKLIFDKKLQI